MLRTTITRIKRVCAFALLPRVLRAGIRYTPGKFERLTPTGHRKAANYSNSGSKDGDERYEKCKRIIDKAFGKEKKPGNDQDLNTLSRMVTQQAKEGSEDFCERCGTVIREPYNQNTDESELNSKGIIETEVISDGSKLHATTSKINEEKLTQKIEKLDEPSLVEAEKSKVEGFNMNPKVLGNQIVEPTYSFGELDNALSEALAEKFRNVRDTPENKEKSFKDKVETNLKDEMIMSTKEEPQEEILPKLHKNEETISEVQENIVINENTNPDLKEDEKELSYSDKEFEDRKYRRFTSKKDVDFALDEYAKRCMQSSPDKFDQNLISRTVNVSALNKRRPPVEQPDIEVERCSLSNQNNMKDDRLEELAKRCLNASYSKIDEYLLKELEKLIKKKQSNENSPEIEKNILLMAQKRLRKNVENSENEGLIETERENPRKEFEENSSKSNSMSNNIVTENAEKDSANIDTAGNIVGMERSLAPEMNTSKDGQIGYKDKRRSRVRAERRKKYVHLDKKSMFKRKDKNTKGHDSLQMINMEESPELNIYNKEDETNEINKKSIGFEDYTKTKEIDNSYRNRTEAIKQNALLNNKQENEIGKENTLLSATQTTGSNAEHIHGNKSKKETPKSELYKTNILLKPESLKNPELIAVIEQCEDDVLLDQNLYPFFKPVLDYKIVNEKADEMLEEDSKLIPEDRFGAFRHTNYNLNIDEEEHESVPTLELYQPLAHCHQCNELNFLPISTINESQETKSKIKDSDSKHLSNDNIANIFQKGIQKTIDIINPNKSKDEPMIASNAVYFENSNQTKPQTTKDTKQAIDENNDTQIDDLKETILIHNLTGISFKYRFVEDENVEKNNQENSEEIQNEPKDQTMNFIQNPNINIDEKPQVKDDVNTNITSGPLLNLDETSTISLQELLRRVRARHRLEYLQACQKALKEIDQVTGKCGKGPPQCPPPAPICPPKCPPPKPPPKPCCPGPCKPKCPTPCPPPPPCCQPEPKKCCNKVHDILSLILYLGLQLHLHNPQLLNDNSTDELTEEIVQRLNNLGHVLRTLYLVNAIRHNRIGCSVSKCDLDYARTYEPWIPIPSWPIPKKEKKQKLVCPQEGCKVKPPPKLNDPCPKQNQCIFPKRTFSVPELFEDVSYLL